MLMLAYKVQTYQVGAHFEGFDTLVLMGFSDCKYTEVYLQVCESSAPLMTQLREIVCSRLMFTFFLFSNHKNVTMTLAWNIIPNAGNLPRIASTGSHSFKFPSEYTTARVI